MVGSQGYIASMPALALPTFSFVNDQHQLIAGLSFTPPII